MIDGAAPSHKAIKGLFAYFAYFVIIVDIGKKGVQSIMVLFGNVHCTPPFCFIFLFYPLFHHIAISFSSFLINWHSMKKIRVERISIRLTDRPTHRLSDGWTRRSKMRGCKKRYETWEGLVDLTATGPEGESESSRDELESLAEFRARKTQMNILLLRKPTSLPEKLLNKASSFNSVLTKNLSCRQQGRIWRAFRAFPGRPWRRTQDKCRTLNR